ncbi:SGNH/GDSL hydrolase family protein [Longimicrobium sp.]|uniref:SGNH/GDSL hydrolase family protein n=1 Tax=Longimicrobium sp. TaxID=2029185 RepID=UPI003B3B8211
MMMRMVLAGVAMMGMLACRGGGTGPVACDGGADGPMRILFIGNSLTYFNELPYMVQALADSAGDAPPVLREVALPDFSLEDHWNDGRAARAIRGGCWNYVVLQQGPSSLAESRELLLEYAARFDGLVREQGGRSALFSVWPAAARRADFARSIESYALAAEQVNGVMLPAATAWLEAWEREPGLDLYQDGLHPTPAGSYLAALTIAARLSGHAPAQMPAALTVRSPDGTQTLRFDPATAATLQAAAQEALDHYPEPFSPRGP